MMAIHNQRSLIRHPIQPLQVLRSRIHRDQLRAVNPRDRELPSLTAIDQMHLLTRVKPPLHFRRSDLQS